MLSPGERSIILAAALLVHAAPSASANIYLFRVSCANETFVAQWDGGPVDRGREDLRIATGDLNLDCSIYDYNASTDRDLPRRWCSGPDGIVRGFPPVLILLGQSHCR